MPSKKGDIKKNCRQSRRPRHTDIFVGKRIKKQRLLLGMSQRQLALPGISYAYISRIESGSRQPSAQALRRLAKKLRVTEDYLAWGRNSEPVLTEREAWVLVKFGDISDEEMNLLELTLSNFRVIVKQADADFDLEQLHESVAV